MKIGRLFVGWGATNETDRRVLASWAYVTGYWRWCLSLRIARDERRFRFGPSYTCGTTYFAGRHFGCWATVPFIGGLSFSTQPPMASMKRWPAEPTP